VRVGFSAAWQRNIEVDELGEVGIDVRLTHRSVDYGLSGWRRLLTYLRDSVAIVRRAGAEDVTIVSSAGLETFVVALIWRCMPRGWRRARSLLVLDPLPLRWRRLDRLFAVGMRAVDLILCVRRGDMDTFRRRFAVPPERCRFVAMPVPAVDLAAGPPGPPDGDGRPARAPGYVYAAGSAHRDWPLLLDAFRLLPGHRCVLATQSLDPSTTPIPDNVELLPAQRIDEGRQLMAAAALVAVTFQDTDLACGPTVLLDAYALGIPVVATDTNACRDYVRDGTTGLLSPPGDARALADNVARMLEDEPLREAMRAAIPDLVEAELTRVGFEARLRELLHEVRSGRTRANDRI
jgi:glycosyltransferase involved in cell wall biosynthesis